MKIKKDIAYGEDDKQKFDVYFPSTANSAAVIVIHGGGWWQGDKKKENKVPKALAKKGYLVLVPNYRLAQGINDEGELFDPEDLQEPENLFPTQIDDLLEFLTFIRDFKELKFDTLGLFGSSSGGNLATELAVREGLPAVSWSGLVDFESFYEKNQKTKMKKRIIKEHIASDKIDQDGSDDPYYKWCLMNLLGGDASVLQEASVLNRISEKTGPMFLAVSLNELVHTYEIQHLTRALIDKGIEVQIQYLKGDRHAEAYFDDAIKPSLAFFKHYLLQK